MQGSAKVLTDYWISKGLQLTASCAPATISEFERRYRIVVPPQLRAYYLSANGMKQVFAHSADPSGFSFWPLEQVIPVRDFVTTPKWPGFAGDEGFFVFADYMQLSWAYAIRLTPNRMNRVILIGKARPELVAESFEQFVAAYVTDAKELYSGAPFDPVQGG